MEKITFVNENAPYVSAENLNQMQTNVENAINGIVESGSNANGNWVKYADGTMIQSGVFTFEGVTATALPTGGYRTLGRTISFPLSFIDTPKSLVAISGSDTNDNGFTANNQQLTASSFAGFWWTINVNNNVLVHTLNWLAIGRWK